MEIDPLLPFGKWLSKPTTQKTICENTYGHTLEDFLAGFRQISVNVGALKDMARIV
jgi:hypothetical protein